MWSEARNINDYKNITFKVQRHKEDNAADNAFECIKLAAQEERLTKPERCITNKILIYTQEDSANPDRFMKTLNGRKGGNRKPVYWWTEQIATFRKECKGKQRKKISANENNHNS